MTTSRNYRLRPRSITFYMTLAAVLWSGALAARAADRYVSPPGGYGTNNTADGYTNWLGAATNIQWAVNVAAPGEKVWVTNGTYALTNEILIANAITVYGFNGREKTFVNGNYPAYTNRCFRITAAAVIDGLTISNGFAATSASGGANGGGAYLNADGAYVKNCTVTRNRAYSSVNSRAAGGGIWASQNSYVINCTVSYNSSDSQGYSDYDNGGGGVFAYNPGNPLISNCVIYANYAGLGYVGYTNNGRGGGVSLYAAGVVANCNIYSNFALAQRGGGFNAYAGGTIRNCILSNNTSANASGICIEYGSTLAEGCLLVGNTGNAVLNYSGYMRNCTVVNTIGNGNFTWGGASFDNCIFYNSSGSDTSGGGNPPNPAYINCRWQGGYSLTNGSGNISSAPQFVNAAAGNYRLANNSPCLNTGTNQGWMTNAFDLDGRMRVRYGTVDMGAYERINDGTVFGFH